MKWRSKITGTTYKVYDSFSTNGRDYEYTIAIFLDGDNFDNSKPRARISIENFLEAFEKVEE